MKTGSFQSVRRVLGLALGTCAALALSIGIAQAKSGGQAATCTITTVPNPASISVGSSVSYTGAVSGKTPRTYDWSFTGGSPDSATSQTVIVTYANAGSFQATLDGTNGKGGTCSASVPVTVTGGTTTTTTVPTTTTTVPTTTTTAVVTTTSVPTTTTTGVVTTTTTLPPLPPPDIGLDNPQTDFKIMMNYELGMHCTGFEFAYCCVLPVYNSILAQVVKPNTQPVGPGTGSTNEDYARLMEGDPNEGTDALGRQTVLRDLELDGNGNFKKYVLKYWHDAQPRNDERGKRQTSTLISAVEGNSLMSWNTAFDSADVDPVTGVFTTGSYNGSDGVVLGDGDFSDPTDNYQNAIWNHLYFYWNDGGPPLEGENPSNSSLEKDKIRLGVSDQPGGGILPTVAYPADCGPAFHPMGPVTTGGAPNDCGGFSNGNVLTYSGENGTVVFTQMKVLENLPIMLTSPDIWEALGLPLTPFEDSIDFFGDPGLVDEDSVRPYVAMKAQMYHFDGSSNDTPVLDGAGNPVIGFGTAPIDIPNCERCHSNAPGTPNSPNDGDQWAKVELEYNYWMSVYPGMATGSDWYARLKSAAISMLNGHDVEHGTKFADCYPYAAGTPGCPDFPAGAPQNTRLGHESIICQKCHADNVIAVVKSATHNGGQVIPPVTEAIHNNHKGVSEGGVVAFDDDYGRSGGCQGCHPAHRSSGDMSGYPITLSGENFYSGTGTSDNRDANGGCFVGRDVHSNPGKDTDGAETPEHLNAVGQWLSDNVYSDQGAEGDKGLWCTNCHQQLGQEIWKAENMEDLVHGIGASNPRGEPTLAAVAAAVGTTEAQAIAWLDPNSQDLHGTGLGDSTHTIWKSDPGLCNYVAGYFDVIPVDPAHDGNVATVEVQVGSAAACSTNDALSDSNGDPVLIDCGDPETGFPGAPAFYLCGSYDGDGDFSVNAMDFCTTPDCVTAAQATLPGGSVAVPVPMSAATDGRDHWLSPGEPHCADCHAAPYVEQSGNINAYPPFNYPRKASLMRYSRGHQDISCQGCHESIHGLYPVTPDIDTTSYAQAAALNHDGSHGPLKCGTCHDVDGNGVPTIIEDLEYDGIPILQSDDPFDAAVSWMHTFTAEADGLDDYCLNCHTDNSGLIASDNRRWTEHSYKGRSSREMMDKAEIAVQGHVGGDISADEDPTNTVCTSCHGDRSSTLSRRGCSTKWNNHLIQGRASEVAWEYMSNTYAGSNCGW